MANKLYQIQTTCGQTRYATGIDLRDALENYTNAHATSQVRRITLVGY